MRRDTMVKKGIKGKKNKEKTYLDRCGVMMQVG